MARQDQIGVVSQFADALETIIHPGQIVVGGEGHVLFKVVVVTLQRHFSVLTKFSYVESRFCGHKRRGKAAFDGPINPCVRSVCSRSVAVGLWRGHGHASETMPSKTRLVRPSTTAPAAPHQGHLGTAGQAYGGDRLTCQSGAWAPRRGCWADAASICPTFQLDFHTVRRRVHSGSTVRRLRRAEDVYNLAKPLLVTLDDNLAVVVFAVFVE